MKHPEGVDLLPSNIELSGMETGLFNVMSREYKTDIPAASKEDARTLVDEYNGKLGVTKAQEEAMKTGSMFGWNVPGADPKNYDMDGKPMKPKDRGDAR